MRTWWHRRANLTAGTVTPLEPGQNPTANISEDNVLTLGIPRGAAGANGITPSFSIGQVSSGDTASVTQTGTDAAPVLNFVLPKGDKGDQGDINNADAYHIRFLLTNEETIAARIATITRTVTRYSVTLDANGWTQGEDGSYTQTVQPAVSWTYNQNTLDARIDVDLEDTTKEQATAILTGWSNVSRVTLDEDGLTATCYIVRPSVSLPVILTVVE